MLPTIMIETFTQIRVRYSETDQMNVVYHGNYAQYFEVARAECIREIGFTYKQIEELGIIMPIVELNIKFIKPAHYDDLLTIKTFLPHLPTNHIMEFFHEVYDSNNYLLTKGKVVLFIIDSKTKVKINLPESMLEKCKQFIKENEKENK